MGGGAGKKSMKAVVAMELLPTMGMSMTGARPGRQWWRQHGEREEEEAGEWRRERWRRRLSTGRR
jgi:hypothetical protein